MFRLEKTAYDGKLEHWRTFRAPARRDRGGSHIPLDSLAMAGEE